MAAVLALFSSWRVAAAWGKGFHRFWPLGWQGCWRKAGGAGRIQTWCELKSSWQERIGGAGDTVLFPAVVSDSIYAAGLDGKIARFSAETGKQQWNIDSGRKISGGVGADSGLVAVGTAKGEVLAFDAKGQPLWQARLSSEILSAPQVANDIVVVRTGDGRIFGLDARDGKRKWVYQRAMPALALRSNAGVVVAHGAVFAGFAGGKLVALNLATGNLGWEATVALPRGATELERVTDISSLPVVDGRMICATAYQGRTACFEIASGNLLWARDVSSSAGLAMDDRYCLRQRYARRNPCPRQEQRCEPVEAGQVACPPSYCATGSWTLYCSGRCTGLCPSAGA